MNEALGIPKYVLAFATLTFPRWRRMPMPRPIRYTPFRF